MTPTTLADYVQELHRRYVVEHRCPLHGQELDLDRHELDRLVRLCDDMQHAEAHLLRVRHRLYAGGRLSPNRANVLRGQERNITKLLDRFRDDAHRIAAREPEPASELPDGFDLWG